MVHALEEIHRLLKPAGALFDIHPVAESSPVEIHQSGDISPVGFLSVRQWCMDYQMADNAIIEIAQRGLFTIDQQSVFDSMIYYPSAAEMGTSLIELVDKFARDAKSAGDAIPHVEALAARTEEMMQTASSNAELKMIEKTHICRLRPI